jgi:hypothetical protein
LRSTARIAIIRSAATASVGLPAGPVCAPAATNTRFDTQEVTCTTSRSARARRCRTQFLVANPLDRYLINSTMLGGMKRGADGSLTIHVRKDSPGKGTWSPPKVVVAD